MKKRCCIVGAAPINNYKRIIEYINPTDYFIFCDAGLKHRAHLGVQPNLIVGDFDSHPMENFSEETIVLPNVKDDTDTVFAAKEALKRGYNNFILIGCIGLRIDHSIGNISLLLMLHNHGATSIMVDDYCVLSIASKKTSYVDDSYPYFSLLCVDGTASGINVCDAYYNLKDASLSPDFPLGISNEPLPGKTAKITVSSGHLLLVRVFDS